MHRQAERDRQACGGHYTIGLTRFVPVEQIQITNLEFHTPGGYQRTVERAKRMLFVYCSHNALSAATGRKKNPAPNGAGFLFQIIQQCGELSGTQEE